MFPLLLLAGTAPTPTIGSHSLVITQFYSGNGTSSNAPYTPSYVEIFNASSQVIDLQNWTLIYSSSSSTTAAFGDSNKQWIGSIDPISTYCAAGCQITYSAAFASSANCTAAQVGQYTPHCVLNPGQYLLIKVKNTSTSGSMNQNFPITPDLDLSAQADPATSALTIISPSSTTGKLALVNAHNSAPSCNYSGAYGLPIQSAAFSPTAVDLVGYGSTTPNCWEGTSATQPSFLGANPADYSNGYADFVSSTIKNKSALVRVTGYAGPHTITAPVNMAETPCADTDNNAANFAPVQVGNAVAEGGTAGKEGSTSWVLHNSYQSYDVTNHVQPYTPTPCSGRSTTPPAVTVTVDQNTIPQVAGNVATVNVTIAIAPSTSPVAILFKNTASSSASGITGATFAGASTWVDGGWDANGSHVYTAVATVPTDNPGTFTVTANTMDDAYRTGTGSAVITVQPATQSVVMMSPVPGSALPGASANFSWQPASGAQQYWMWMGTTLGSMDLYNQGQGLNTSAVVAGLPTNGTRVYVRLFAMVGGAWVWNDYAYTAASPTPATMISPAPASALPGASVNFNWSAGAGAQQYWMWIGTTPGGMQLYNEGQGLNTSAVVNGLPTDGSAVYVRLFTVLNGVWQWNDYTYTAASPTKAAMTSPAPASTLPGSSVNFNWSAGAAAQQYWMWIGTTPGGMELYNQGQGLNTSAVVNGLPTNGSNVYVRLFTVLSGAWQWNDYTYTAASPAAAIMISPTNGSTLPGSSVNFTWSPGIGAQQYWMWVGTMPASQSDTDPARYSFFNQSLGLNTSTMVNGIPSDGSTVYVRLFTVLNGAWHWNDYSYTTPVISSFQVNGNVGLANTGGPNGPTGVPGITVSLSTSPVRTTTTDSSGNFSFSSVPNGTYTVTPSITAPPSSVFYPATQSVSNSSSQPPSFMVALGYTVSGTVNYTTGSKTGTIYLTLQSSNNSGFSLGTSISAKGAFSIRGVPPGNYTLHAWMDNIGFGTPNASNPAGNTFELVVSNSNVNGASVTLNDPSSGPDLSTSSFKLQGVSAIDQGAVVQVKSIMDSNNVELPASYQIQWSTDQTFATGVNSTSFTANGGGNGPLMLRGLPGLTNTANLYFRARGQAGSSNSLWSSTVGPVTIGAGTGSNVVSGSVTFAGTATGPLYVGFYDQNNGKIYAATIANPVSPQNYTVSGVPTGSNYFFFGIIDQNNDGMVGPGDISNTGQGGGGSVAITTNTTGQNLVLPSGNVTVSLATNHSQLAGQSVDQYGLNFNVRGLNKLPVAVALVSGPNLVTPTDIAVSQGKGGEFQFWPGTFGARPNVGDAYGLQITYSDGSSEPVNPTVGAVLDAFATNLAPTGSGSGNTTPTFSWTDPANAANYTYSFMLGGPTGNVWQIPSNNSNSSSFSSSTTSLTWGIDPTGGNSLPNVGSLTVGTQYWWQVSVTDSLGNSAMKQANYTP